MNELDELIPYKELRDQSESSICQADAAGVEREDWRRYWTHHRAIVALEEICDYLKMHREDCNMRVEYTDPDYWLISTGAEHDQLYKQWKQQQAEATK